MFLGLVLAACLGTSLWVGLGLPRAEGASELSEPAWCFDGAGALPAPMVRDMERRVRRLRLAAGVRLEVHTHPRAGDGAAWRATVLRERLEGLPEGVPTVLVLVAGDPPGVTLASNQGLDRVLDATVVRVLADHEMAPQVRRQRVDLGVRRVVEQVCDRLEDALRSQEDGPWRGRRWPRRWHGYAERDWHRGSLGLLVGLATTILALLVVATLRRPRAGGRPGGFEGVPFTGGNAAGGFGGAARGGGAPPPGW